MVLRRFQFLASLVVLLSSAALYADTPSTISNEEFEQLCRVIKPVSGESRWMEIDWYVGGQCALGLEITSNRLDGYEDHAAKVHFDPLARNEIGPAEGHYSARRCGIRTHANAGHALRTGSAGCNQH